MARDEGANEDSVVRGDAGSPAVVVTQRVESLILLIRGQKVILDSDLAALYGVTTKRLNEQVRRNSCLLYTSPSPRD